MKKLFILSAAFAVFAISANAQTKEAIVKNEIKADKKEKEVAKKEKKGERKALRKLEGKEVSYQAKQAFYKDFGNFPKAQWIRTDNFDKVTFSKDGQKMDAYYDYDSKLVGTTQAKTFADLPAKAQKEINQKYGDYTKKAITFFDDNELNETDMILFGNQFDDADNYFVELAKGNSRIILQVSTIGDVSYFTKM